MQFTVPCETFARLSVASMNRTDPDKREFFKCVRLENRGGKRFAVASNTKVLVAEFLGETDEPDGWVNVVNDESLIIVCENEGVNSSTLTVTFDQASGWAVAMTTAGFMYPGNASVPGDWPIEWRTLIPLKLPTKPNGATAFHSGRVADMGDASPSGRFVLPQFIDKDVIILVRDAIDPNWLGLFMTWESENQSFGPATIPEWIK